MPPDPLQEITARMEKARATSLLGAPCVTLVAVSKSQPTEALLALLKAGQRVFGENRVQEAMEKWPHLREQYPDIRLHLIGSLQTNKVKEALRLFDVIETIDRENLVDALAKELGKLPTANCQQFFIQVNTGEEPQKSGVAPLQFPALLAYARKAGLNITGLMCVPPADDNPAPHFALLYKMAKQAGLASLSMGMSGDFETAIRLGATHIRIGTALFGDRK